MRIKTLEELRPLLVRLPDERRRAILEAFRDSGQRAAARINEALDFEDSRRFFGRCREFEEAAGRERAGRDPSAKPRGSKYGNKLVEDEGELFHSVGEWRRWLQLQQEQRAGLIEDLERQVEYPLAAGGEYVCSWFADFRYKRAGAVVVEDFKGFRTDVYKLKKKFVEATYKFRIFETGTKKKHREPRAKSKTYTATRRRTVKP